MTTSEHLSPAPSVFRGGTAMQAALAAVLPVLTESWVSVIFMADSCYLVDVLSLYFSH